MRATAPAPAVAGAAAGRAPFPFPYPPTSAPAPEYGVSPSHVYFPPTAHRNRIVYRQEASPTLQSDAWPRAEVTPAYGTPQALPSPSGATPGAFPKTTAAAVATQRNLRADLPHTGGSSSVAAGNSTYSSSWGGARYLDTVPTTTNTPCQVTRPQVQRQGHISPTVTAATVQGVGGTKATPRKNSPAQPTQQVRSGMDSVYTRREKIRDISMQALQRRKGPLSFAEAQRQQQKLMLREHLPAFFPAAEEGEQSEDGKKLSRVLAFQRCAAATAAAEAASERKRERLDWKKATVAMAAFGLPQDVQCAIIDDERWKLAYPRNSLAVESPFPADSQFYLFMALVAEGSRRYEEADAYMLRMVVANALQKAETPVKQRTYMQKVLARRLRHQRNVWTQTVALEQALQTRQSAVEDRPSSAARLEKRLQLEEVLSYKQRLKSEIIRHCYGVIWTAIHLLKPYVVTVAGRVFVHKIMGAAYRQATQYTAAIPQYECLELAKENYEIAVGLANLEGSLEVCDMNRLELLIGWTNFLFYNLKEHEKALREGRKVLQEALHVLPHIKEEKKFNDVVEALQTLMRSIRRWMQETQQDAVFDWWMG